jgi:hypothetical protein
MSAANFLMLLQKHSFAYLSVREEKRRRQHIKKIDYLIHQLSAEYRTPFRPLRLRKKKLHHDWVEQFRKQRYPITLQAMKTLIMQTYASIL